MRFVVVAAFAALGLVVLSNGATAQSTDVISRRLDVLEKKNEALEKENTSLRDRMRRLEASKKRMTSAPPPAASSHPLTASAPLAAFAMAGTRAEAVLTPAFTWTGFYIGAHGGYAGGKLMPPCCNGGGGQGNTGPGDNGQGNTGPVGNGQGNTGPGGNGGATSNAGFANVGLSGGFGGVQAGYNYQFAPHWLFGVEQDISFGNISGSQIEPMPNPTVNIETKYSGTIRERFGYIWDRLFLYETAGIAWAVNRTNLQFQDPTQGQSVSETHWQYGVALGAGMEWAIGSNLSIKAEYLYSYLTKEQYFSGTSNAGLASWPLSTVRVGMNWRFN